MLSTVYLTLVVVTLALIGYLCFRKLDHPVLGLVWGAMLATVPPAGWVYLCFLYNTQDRSLRQPG
ncbi:hypothetical protein [Ferrimonas marina]|uniref:Uncharacterized protein n=1 Tax=Ferrimonas marina TaxID=299255 RepID=A0A1M5ZKS3_9GAMM|nr:hypothetical protein [Ferrimonas marina]SHI24907.1 hypothetical protein SAMN02745129_0390 [Ferrimonas marina]